MTDRFDDAGKGAGQRGAGLAGTGVASVGTDSAGVLPRTDEPPPSPQQSESALMLITREHAFRAAQNAVRNQGYAVAAHGSWVKDLDLIAVPWRETAIDAQTCAELIAKAIPGEVVGEAEEKPYGRLAWTIYPKYAWGFDRWYVDLSVMPRAAAAKTGVKPCPSCRGVGDQRVVAGDDTDEPCSTCGGEGVVRHEAQPTGVPAQEAPCPDCTDAAAEIGEQHQGARA